MIKKCRNCLEEKNINEFHKHNGNYRLDCKFCYREKERGRRVSRLLKIDKDHAIRVITHQENIKNRGQCPADSSWCYKCNQYKIKADFSPHNYKNNGCCRECSTNNDIQRNRILKIKAIDYLGGKCKRCGFTGHYSAYDFHHINYLEKEFDWGVARKKSFEKIIPELDKCNLLCRNCHQIIHTKLNNDGSLNHEYIPTNI